MDSKSRNAIIVTVSIVIIIILTRFTIPKRNNAAVQSKFSTLVEQAKHWHFVAQQDQNILMALVHINTALCKLHTLQTLLPTAELNRYCDGNFQQLQLQIQNYHQKVLQGFEEAAPQIALPSGTTVDLYWYI